MVKFATVRDLPIIEFQGRRWKVTNAALNNGFDYLASLTLEAYEVTDPLLTNIGLAYQKNVDDYLRDSGKTMSGEWIYSDDKNEVSDVRVTKVKTMDGWLVQAFMTINGQEVIVSQRDFEEDEVEDGDDAVKAYTETVVQTLRSLLA